ncbi:hypothetical protein NHQ30_008011 [Ciborinia camelliae]|nr:hypothetical protein NHQ30_008011 [Ciborinia camelliae]
MTTIMASSDNLESKLLLAEGEFDNNMDILLGMVGNNIRDYDQGAHILQAAYVLRVIDFHLDDIARVDFDKGQEKIHDILLKKISEMKQKYGEDVPEGFEESVNNIVASDLDINEVMTCFIKKNNLVPTPLRDREVESLDQAKFVWQIYRIRNLLDNELDMLANSEENTTLRIERNINIMFGVMGEIVVPYKQWLEDQHESQRFESQRLESELRESQRLESELRESQLLETVEVSTLVSQELVWFGE